MENVILTLIAGAVLLWGSDASGNLLEEGAIAAV